MVFSVVFHYGTDIPNHFDHVIKQIINGSVCIIELWMHMGGLLSTQKASVAPATHRANDALLSRLATKTPASKVTLGMRTHVIRSLYYCRGYWGTGLVPSLPLSFVSGHRTVVGEYYGIWRERNDEKVKGDSFPSFFALARTSLA